MSATTRVEVGDLLRRPGSRREWEQRISMGELRVTSGRVAGPVRAALELDSTSSGIVVSGRVEIDWAGECRRCLGDVTGVEAIEIREVFEPRPASDESAQSGTGW